MDAMKIYTQQPITRKRPRVDVRRTGNVVSVDFGREVIERQLAHAERDKVKAAYNHAEYMPERREMMQAWADWIDGLKRPL